MKIALTFDDFLTYDSTKINEVSNKLLEILITRKIKILGFANPISFTGKEELVYSIAQTHWLGNHTYSHLDYENTEFHKFCEDVSRCEESLEKYYSEDQGDRRFFRFPWLKRGNSKKDRLKIIEFLQTFNYQFVHAAFDSYDWVFERYLKECSKLEMGTFKALGDFYVNFVVSHIEDTGKLVERIYNRSVPLVGLFHWNLMNASYLDVIFDELKSRGYTFCCIEEALNDQAYRQSPVIYKTSQFLLDPFLPKLIKLRKAIFKRSTPFPILTNKIKNILADGKVSSGTYAGANRQ